MLAIVTEKIIERSRAFPLARVRPQRSLNQHWCAIADVTRDGLVIQFLAFHFTHHRVHCKHQIEFGINQRAVKIEDQDAHVVKRFFGSEYHRRKRTY